MSTEPNQERWRDLVLRRELTAAEAREVAAWLQDHPEEAAAWETDMALARAVRAMPAVPVASNFTAQVMAEVGRIRPIEGRGAGRNRGGGGVGWWRAWGGRWMPVAGGLAVLVATGVAGWQIRTVRRDSEYVRQVAALKAMADLPPVVLRDFEAIQRFAETAAPVDFGLLAALE